MNNISIIIPCYNEEKRIINTFLEVHNYCEKNFANYEIILVNDGSKDNTIFCEFFGTRFNNILLISYKNNKGKGYAVRMGLLAAKYNNVIFMDADNSTKINEIEKFYKYIDQYSLIIGSRNLKTSNIILKQNNLRKLSGHIFSKLTQLILNTEIKDTQCGFKYFYMPDIKKIISQCKVNRWAFDAEIIYLAQKNNIKIKEIGIDWKNDCNSKLNLFKDSFKMFIDLIKIRFRA